jgi:hypothetical protein
MKRSSALALGASLALIAFSQAFAQQNLPAMPGGGSIRVTPYYEAPAGGGLHPFVGQGVPGTNAQDLPGGGRRSGGGLYRFPQGGNTFQLVDKCALAGIDKKDLDALRVHIVELLKKDAAATKSFIDAESWIEKDCARERGVFYIKALARIKG